MKQQTKNYTLKILENKKVVSRIQTHSLRRFTTHLASINSQEKTLRFYLRVSYGKAKDWKGEESTFYNDCWCESKEQLLEMFEYFRHENL